MLAIIIPYYKIDFFDATLQSLANQTDKSFNVYIGDDLSPENPNMIINKYRDVLNISYTKFEDNLGSKSLTKQWERCIALSKKEPWIMILGDDDVLGNNVVELFYKEVIVRGLNTNLIRFSSQLINQNDIPITKIYNHPELEYGYEFYGRKLKFLTRCSLSEHIFLREAYNEVKFHSYPLAWCSDDRFFLEMSKNVPAIAINEATVYPRNSEINISGNQSKNKLKGEVQIEFYEWVWKNYRNKIDMESRLALLSVYSRIYKELYPGIPVFQFFLKKYIETKNIRAVLSFMKNNI